MHRRSYIVTLSLLVTGAVQAAIPFTWIAGLDDVVKPSYSYLSLVNGLAWSSNQIVENMYRYGTDTDATIKLIKELFYLQRDEVSFVPTVRDDKPASYWGVVHAGKILAVIQQHRHDNTFNIQACKTALTELLLSFKTEPVMQDKAALRLELQRQLGVTGVQQLTDAIRYLKGEQFKTVGAQQVRHLLSEQALKRYDTLISESSATPNLQQINQEVLGIIKGEIQRLEQERQKLQKSLKEDKNRTAKQRKLEMLDIVFADDTYASLASLIAEAVQESMPGNNQKYMPYTVEQILLAFAWVKANPREHPENPKQDIIDFFTPLTSYIEPERLAQWLVHEPYGPADHARCKQQISALGLLVPSFLLNNYGLAMFSVQAYRAWDQPLPLIVTGRTAYYRDPAGGTYFFSDCGETSLRNFFNIVLRDRDNNSFSIEYLTQAAARPASSPADSIVFKPCTPLINFYKKYSSIANLTAQALYDAWTQVVENLPGVEYLQCSPSARYEIKPGLSNILQVFNNLLLSNTPTFSTLTKKEQLDLICHALSRDNFALSWTAKDDVDIENNDFVELIFTVKTPRDSVRFFWKFQQHHFVLSGPEQMVYPIERAQVEQLAITFDIAQEIPCLRTYTMLSNYLTVSTIQSVAQVAKDHLTPTLWSTLFMATTIRNQPAMAAIVFRFFTDTQAVRTLMRKLLEAYIMANTEIGTAVALSFITDINPDNDSLNAALEYLIIHASQPSIADSLLQYIFDDARSNAFEPSFINTHIMKLVTPSVIASIAEDIIKNNLTSYASSMHDILLRSKNVQIMRITGLFILERNYQPWFDLLNTWIGQGADDLVAQELITTVLNKDRAPLFTVAQERAARLSFEFRAHLIGSILNKRITGWYAFVGAQLMLLQDDADIIAVAKIIVRNKITELYTTAQKKLQTVNAPDRMQQAQALMRQLLQ